MTSTVAQGVVSDGHGLVLWVPAIADPKAPTVAELTAPGVIDLTYLLFADGFDHQIDVTTFETTRYTLAQIMEHEGTRKDSITLKYPIEGKDSDVARIALARGATGWIVERLGTPNEDAVADGQYLSMVAPARTGIQKKLPVAQNTEIGLEQALYPTGTVETNVFVGGGGATDWELEIQGSPTGGTFALFVNGYRTSDLAHNATHTAIQTAVNGLSGVTSVTVTATSGTPIGLVFSDKVSLSVDDLALTGGTSPHVEIARA